MFYSLVSSFKYHPDACLQETNYEDAIRVNNDIFDNNINYNGTFIANDFPPESLIFTDIIDTLSGIKVVSHNFMDFLTKICPSEVIFSECTLTYSGHNILDYIGDDVKGFYIMKVVKYIDIIDKTKKPINFYPKLKKFKLEDFVMKKVDDDFSLCRDEKELNKVISSEEMKSLCETAGMNIDFRPLPYPF
ncbi:imm11 family protein [Serratia sp. DD3]|uniref:imm11 family protein n=1 Tax=Serratia sp. DD3 TaxID=1410619 RepID=UPI0004D48B41|nr:DUF1629 domain-containing protein [Serratia sp. DD3]KEY59969.1 hypothetical protein SRDD_10790 [Serratia sp. DD3]